MTIPNAGSNETTASASFKRPIRRSSLAAILGLQIILLIWLVYRDPMTLYRIQTALGAHVYQAPSKPPENFGNDPRVGTELGAIYAGASRLEKIASPSKAGYLIISVGDCASCMGMDLKAVQQQAATRAISTVLFTTAPPRKAQTFLGDGNLHVPIYSDTDERLSSGLDTLWNGRCYLFSKNWRLIWLQHKHTPGYSPLSDADLNHLFGASMQ